jgi:hypothetical protein
MQDFQRRIWRTFAFCAIATGAAALLVSIQERETQFGFSILDVIDGRIISVWMLSASSL